MLASIEYQNSIVTVDLSKPIDISIAISPNGPRAWYVGEAQIAPVINRHFTGSVKLGGAVNFKNIFFNPHGHGTHTESVGHIAHESFPISKVLTQYFFIAKLISVTPQTLLEDSQWSKRGDAIITKGQLQAALKNSNYSALIIRTLPNDPVKRTKNYSDTNFCYLHYEALQWLAEQGVEHLLVDLPSVDRESDGGLLKAHHAFWQYPHNTRKYSTITEFIYVNDEISDGEYLLNLQVASFDNDAAPSRPVLFPIISRT